MAANEPKINVDIKFVLNTFWLLNFSSAKYTYITFDKPNPKKRTKIFETISAWP